MLNCQVIINAVLEQCPNTQAIYLFGSYGTEDEWPNSDIDIAVLMPVMTAKQVKCRDWINLSMRLAEATEREKVDLVNLRKTNVVLRKEIIIADRRVYCADEHAADEFEMLTLSLYQQLQEERKEIIEDIIQSGSILRA